jgi:hypothetical protein
MTPAKLELEKSLQNLATLVANVASGTRDNAAMQRETERIVALLKALPTLDAKGYEDALRRIISDLEMAEMDLNRHLNDLKSLKDTL